MTTDRDAADGVEARALLPCPFCGGEAEIIHIADGENAGGSCVCCTVCMASGNVEFEFKENFVSNWNRRAIAKALAQPADKSPIDVPAQIAAEGMEIVRGYPVREQPAGEGGVPEGWKLVPVEPTEAMLEAAVPAPEQLITERRDVPNYERDMRNAVAVQRLVVARYYRDCLSAAPVPPAADRERDLDAGLRVLRSITHPDRGAVLDIWRAVGVDREREIRREVVEKCARVADEFGREWGFKADKSKPNSQAEAVCESAASAGFEIGHAIRALAPSADAASTKGD